MLRIADGLSLRVNEDEDIMCTSLTVNKMLAYILKKE